MLIFASSTRPSIDQFQKRLDARRQRLESMRSLNAKRLQQDVKRIAAGEIEFAKSVLNEILPFNIKVNDEAFANAISSFPVFIEWKADAPISTYGSTHASTHNPVDHDSFRPSDSATPE